MKRQNNRTSLARVYRQRLLFSFCLLLGAACVSGSARAAQSKLPDTPDRGAAANYKSLVALGKSGWLPWLEPGSRLGDILNVEINAPVRANPPDDPLKAAPRSAGKLIYTARILVPGWNTPENALLLEDTTSNKAANIHMRTYYHIGSGGLVFEPQFSPSGQYVLYRDGYPQDQYCLTGLIDLKNGKWKPVLSDRDTADPMSGVGWSPGSHFLYYTEGGGHAPFGHSDPPLLLYTYEVATGKSHFIAQIADMNSFAWTHEETMLCAFDGVQQAIADRSAHAFHGAGEPGFPAIWEVPATGGKLKLVVPRAYNPAPSPDGRWITCLGWPYPANKSAAHKPKGQKDDGKAIKDSNTQSERTPPAGPITFDLFDRKTGKRYGIASNVEQNAPGVWWTPDSKQMVLVYGANKESVSSEVVIQTLKVTDLVAAGGASSTTGPKPTVNPRTVIALENLTSDGEWDDTPVPPSRVMGVSADGSSLFVSVTLNGKLTTTVEAINLNTGAVTILAELGSNAGVDWREETGTAALSAPHDNPAHSANTTHP